MKNKCYKILAITMLLGISIFCYLYLVKLNDSKFNAIDTYASSVDNKNKDEKSKDDTKNEIPKPIFYNTLPRVGTIINDISYQNIGGDNTDTLKSAFVYKGATYIIFDTCSKNYDIHSENESVAIAKLDGTTLQKITILNTGDDEKFLSMKLIADGLVILTSSNTHSALYKVNFDLVVLNQNRINKINDGKLLFNNSNLYLQYITQNSFVVSRLDGLEIADEYFLNIRNPTTFFTFINGDTIDFVINTDNGYSFASFVENSGFTYSKRTLNICISSIIPYNSGYVGLCNYLNKPYLFTADNRLLDVQKIELADSKFSYIFTNKENICLYQLLDTSSELNIYCKHLDLVFSNETPLISNILYHDYSNNSIIGFYQNTLSVYSFDNFLFSVEYSIRADDSYTYLLNNGQICYTSSFLDNNSYKNYGMADVYVLERKQE